MSILIGLFLLIGCHGYKYCLVNAITGQGADTNRTKELISTFYHDHIYNTNRGEDVIELYQGSEKILNMTSTLQFDLVIAAMDNLVTSNSSCDWKHFFESASTEARFIVLFTDSKWCGTEPYHMVAHVHDHRKVLFPVMVGPHVDMMQMYHIMGPCQKPGCRINLNYMVFDH